MSAPTTKPLTHTAVGGRIIGSGSLTLAANGEQIHDCGSNGVVGLNPLGQKGPSTIVGPPCSSSGSSATIPSVPAVHSASFVGTYEVELTTHGLPGYFDGGRLSLNADGTATGAGIAAHWGNRGENIVIVERPGPGLAGSGGGALSGLKTPTGIASKQRPGEWIRAGIDAGVWFGVKV